jgi:hypothetical protein
MLHPSGVVSRDDFWPKIIDLNNAGARTLTGRSSTLEPESGRSRAEFRLEVSKWLWPDLRGNVLSHLRSMATIEYPGWRSSATVSATQRLLTLAADSRTHAARHQAVVAPNERR